MNTFPASFSWPAVPYTLLLNKHVGRTFVLGSYKDPFAYVTKDYIQGFVRSIYTTPASADAILEAYPLKNYACKCAARAPHSKRQPPLDSRKLPPHQAVFGVFPVNPYCEREDPRKAFAASPGSVKASDVCSCSGSE